MPTAPGLYPDGHPFKYYPDPLLLDFSDLTRIGVTDAAGAVVPTVKNTVIARQTFSYNSESLASVIITVLLVFS